MTFPTNKPQSSNTNYNHHTPQQATAHYVQVPNNQPIQFVQAPNYSYQLVSSGNQFQLIQAPVTPNTSTQSSSQASSSNNTQQALFTQGYVDWSSLPDDVGHALFTSETPLNLALMAIDSSDDSIPADSTTVETTQAEVTHTDPPLSASSESLAAAAQVTP